MKARWPTHRLGDIFYIARGGSPRPIDKFVTDDPSGLNWIKIGDATASGKFIETTKEKIKPEGLSKSRFVNPGDFLLTNSMSFGRPYIMATDGCIHDGWLVLKPHDRNLADQDYFYHLLGSDTIYKRFAARASGSTVKNLNTDIVSSIDIMLPPLDEQRRIAAILDKADALRRKRKRALDLLDSLTQSIFLEMFGDPVNNPKDWDVKPLGEISHSRLGKMLDQKKMTGLSRRPYLANCNVQWDRFDLNDVKHMGFSESEMIEFRLQPGDLLICEGGEIGRSAIWNEEISDCYYQKALHRVRCIEQLCTPEYLLWYFWFMATRGGLAAHTSVATIAHLTGVKLKGLRVPLPPMKLQTAFSNMVAAVKHQRELMNTTQRRSESLFSSLQSRAFSGQL